MIIIGSKIADLFPEINKIIKDRIPSCCQIVLRGNMYCLIENNTGEIAWIAFLFHQFT
jgi:hypothetical protein